MGVAVSGEHEFPEERWDPDARELARALENLLNAQFQADRLLDMARGNARAVLADYRARTTPK